MADEQTTTENKGTQGQGQTQGQQEPATDDMPFKSMKDFNKAMSARDARILNSVNKVVADALAKFQPVASAPVASEEDETVDESEEEQQAVSDKPVPKGARKPSAAEIAAKKAMTQVKNLEKKMQEERAAAEAAKKLAEEKEERLALTQALTEVGVRGSKAALNHLKAEGRIGRNADGELIFKMPRDGYEEEMSLEEGLTEWLSTDEGKLFAPPRGSEGSNASQTRASARKPGQKMDKSEAANIVAGFLTRR